MICIPLMEKLKVCQTKPKIIWVVPTTYASDLNDEDGLTFDEIADLLDIALLEHEAGVPDKELIV
jgi:hypothetical protein